MPKSQIIEPAEERKAGTLSFAEIPLNQYQQDIDKEKEAYGADGLVGMYEDMLLIREFESMLQSIKTQGSYEGIEYDHKGPAHLSIGQEASAVGQAFLLGVDDHIFGSHRSHGEILAKGMSAIRKLDDDSLLHHGELSWRRLLPCGGEGRVELGQGLGKKLPALWGSGRNLRAGERIQSWNGWLDACLLSTIRDSSQQCYRGRICGYSHGRIPFQKSEPKERNSHFQYR